MLSEDEHNEMKRWALVLFLAACLVACHRRPAPEVTTEIVAAEDISVTANAAPNSPVPLRYVAPEPETEASLRMFIEHGGRALPASWECHFNVYADASDTAPMASAACGDLAHFPPGSRSVEITLRIGQVTRKERLLSERIDGARLETHELSIPMGRLRVMHVASASPSVSQCTVALTSGGQSVATGADDQYFDVFAGTYDATFICQAAEGVRSPTVTGIVLPPAQEKELRLAVLGPQVPTPDTQTAALPPIVDAPAPVPGAPNAGAYALPGAPAQQQGAPDYGQVNP